MRRRHGAPSKFGTRPFPQTCTPRDRYLFGARLVTEGARLHACMYIHMAFTRQYLHHAARSKLWSDEGFQWTFPWRRVAPRSVNARGPDERDCRARCSLDETLLISPMTSHYDVRHRRHANGHRLSDDLAKVKLETAPARVRAATHPSTRQPISGWSWQSRERCSGDAVLCSVDAGAADWVR